MKILITVSRLIFGLILAIPLRISDAIGAVNIVWRQSCLNSIGMVIAFAARKIGSQWGQSQAEKMFALRHLDANSDWEHVAAHISRMDSISDRIKFSRSAVSVFWIRGRFDQARLAADYWCETVEGNANQYITTDKVEEYKSDSGKVATSPDNPFPGLLGDIAAFSAGIRTARRHPILFLYREYKSAHIARGILNWSLREGDISAHRLLSKLPFYDRWEPGLPSRPNGGRSGGQTTDAPLVYNLKSVFRLPIVLFGGELAGQLGIAESDYRKIEQDAEYIPNSRRSRESPM